MLLFFVVSIIILMFFVCCCSLTDACFSPFLLVCVCVCVQVPLETVLGITQAPKNGVYLKIVNRK